MAVVSMPQATFAIEGLVRTSLNRGAPPSCNNLKPLPGKVSGLGAPMSANSVKRVRSTVVTGALADGSRTMADVGNGDHLVVPRMCTLKEFSEDIQGGDLALARPSDQESDRSLVTLLAANVEASAQVADFETLSGRLAMIGFAAALSVEFVTGNSVFEGMDVGSLARVLALCLAATGAAAGFAVGWRSKKHVSDILANGCKSIMDTAVDSLIEGLFYDDKEVVVSADKARK